MEKEIHPLLFWGYDLPKIEVGVFSPKMIKKEVEIVRRENQDELRTQVEYGNLDQRGDLTGPDTDKANYPRRPQHVSIKQQQKGETEQ